MSTTFQIELTPPEYGAVELKLQIRKNTIRGFIITICAFFLLMLIYFLTIKIQESSNAIRLAPIVKLKLEDLPPPQQAEDIAAPPPDQIINTGPASRAGTPVPVPDALLKEDLKDFATMEELGRASAKGGEGVDLGGFAPNIDFNADNKVKVAVREKEPSPDEFIPVEKEPQVDLEKLQKKIIYPDVARRAGIEGKVIVRVLIGKDGKIKKSQIEYSDSQLLNESALKAIADYGVATPGIQNGQPITVWVNIPITFKLR